ncbi:thioesterase family protein [Undibacterium sp. Ji83W]|uniref:thioesterase family protein n=1 Tax=Undibacterium sp. Ji83W TaxID=3413043 RepID=UPI003BF0BD91
MYEKTLIAGWGDMDFNSHMRNTAYLDKSADVRMMYFADCGFPMAEFMRLRIGPVVMKDEIEYFREFHLLDEVTVTLSLAGLSDDGRRLKIRNEFFNKGKLAARVTSLVGWLDLNARKLMTPPDKLLEAMRQTTRAEDFVILPDSSQAN